MAQHATCHPCYAYDRHTHRVLWMSWSWPPARWPCLQHAPQLVGPCWTREPSVSASSCCHPCSPRYVRHKRGVAWCDGVSQLLPHASFYGAMLMFVLTQCHKPSQCVAHWPQVVVVNVANAVGSLAATSAARLAFRSSGGVGALVRLLRGDVEPAAQTSAAAALSLLAANDTVSVTCWVCGAARISAIPDGSDIILG
jgi:hypothetical protein